MKKIVSIALVIVSGIAAGRSVLTARAAGEKLDRIYGHPELCQRFMDETPEGELVRMVTAFKYDYASIQKVAVLNLTGFALAVTLAAMELRKRKAQPATAGDGSTRA